MSYPSDRDGKSKTASAVDQDHYPEQHEVDEDNGAAGSEVSPTHEQISVRAFELWHARGCPDGSADRDWAAAEQELRDGAPRQANARSGSVQH